MRSRMFDPSLAMVCRGSVFNVFTTFPNPYPSPHSWQIIPRIDIILYFEIAICSFDDACRETNLDKNYL